MSNWRIDAILDRTGKSPKQEAAALNRIGRVMKLEPDSIGIGLSLFMECIAPGFNKSMITSPVNSVDVEGDMLRITTDNSVYLLSAVPDNIAVLDGENN